MLQRVKNATDGQGDVRLTARASADHSGGRTESRALDIIGSRDLQAPWSRRSRLQPQPNEGTFAALKSPAGMYIDMRGVNDTRRHLSSMRQRLNAATHTRRQVDIDLQELRRALRVTPDIDSTVELSWTDSQGHRQNSVVMSQAEARQLEVNLENLQMEKDDEVQQLRDTVASAERSFSDAQQDVSRQIQFESNLMQVRHDTSMSIIKNIGR